MRRRISSRAPWPWGTRAFSVASVESQSVPPEQCLRSLTAEALLKARPERALLPDSLGVMATANAFVMLGLVAEDRAE